MGYTHYWTFNKGLTAHKYKKALTACRKIIRSSPVLLGNGYGEGKPKLTNGIMINGVGDDSHETFGLPVTPQFDSQGQCSEFCKTAQKPYDVVVVACLCVLKHHLGHHIEVSSDGDPHEWEDGRSLASKVLGREVKIPQTVLDQCCMYGWAAKMYRAEHPEYLYTPLDITHPGHKTENVPNYAKVK